MLMDRTVRYRNKLVEENAMGKYFNLNEVFPPIENVIESLCQKNGIAPHDAIVVELMKHPKGSLLVELASRKNSGNAKEWLAGNMVDWLSAHYNQSYRSEFKARFDRIKQNDCWAYFLRK
jgi:hypothetical protein